MKTTRFIPGHPLGLSTGVWVEVKEIARLGSGIRYRVVNDRNVGYWVDEDAIEPLST